VFFRSKKLNSFGFTLIEIMAVLVIMSVWSAVAVKKVIAIADTAEQNAIVKGISELNTRESLTWFDLKMSPTGYENDDKLWATMDLSLGDEYIWETGPTRDGGNLRFGSTRVALKRQRSEPDYPGKWSI